MISAAFAQIEFGGYYENYLLGGAKRVGGAIYGDLNRLRLRIDSALSPNVSLHLEPEYDLLVKSEIFPLVGVSRVDQLVWDRAFFKISVPQADVTLGKQRIAWGTGYIWNPTDVFNPFTLSFAVEEEQEQEVEAVRVEAPLGALAGIDAFVLTGDEWLNLKKGIRTNTTIGLYDLALSYVDLGKGAFQLGFDTSGELLGLGVRGEIAMVAPAAADRYFNYVLGWGYTLENGWGMDMEYYYNGRGEHNKEDYDWTGLLAGNINQLGRDYYYFGLHKMLDEITGIRFSLLLNADDLSSIFYPSFSRNISQNIDVGLDALLQGGEDGSEYHPTLAQDPTGLMGSNIIFARLKYSF
jgi:hypothetical protein